MNKKKKLDQNTIKTAKRLLKYMTATYKAQFILVFICIFISSVASISVSLSLKFLLDDFIIPLIGQTDQFLHWQHNLRTTYQKYTYSLFP